MHGVTLERIVTHLRDEYGWAELGRRVPVRCFQQDPSVTSSLKFLRRVPWAREAVEREYLRLRQQEEVNPFVRLVRQGAHQELLALIASGDPSASQAKAHLALGWMLRHLPGQDEKTLRHVLLPVLGFVQDVNFRPEGAPMPLLSLAIDREAPAAFIRELLNRGADANDARFWLPLLHTTDVEGMAYRESRRAPRTDVLDLLLAHGADPNRADERGYTALEIARAYGLKAVLNKLSPLL
nr:VF530 family DNA-binding protein [Deinococcus aestuarii]